MALSNLNRPKLRKYSPRIVSPGVFTQETEDSGVSLKQSGPTQYTNTTTGGMFFGSQLQNIGDRLGGTLELQSERGGFGSKTSNEFGSNTSNDVNPRKMRVGELGGFRQKLSEKFSKIGNTFFDSNITIINVPKRHKPGVANYFPTPGGVTDLDAMGFTKNMQLRESKFIGITEDGKNYKYPNTLKLNLGMPGNTNDDILAKSYFPGPMGSEELHATGFTKFFIDKTKSQFVGISKDGKSYKYPVVEGLQGIQNLFLKVGHSRTVKGIGNIDFENKEGVDYFSGNQRVGADGIHTLPLGFWKNIGKDKTELPHNSRSQLAYMVTAGDLAGKYVFGFGPPTEKMAVDSPHMWQLSSKSIIPDVPNTWDVRGQTMWDQMGEYPWDVITQPTQQSKGVNFMAGTKKGKTFNPDHDLHPYGFTTNMGKSNWQTGDPYTGIASRLAIPIDENGDRTKLKISTNLDGKDGYDFPYPGQSSWHIRKHHRRRFTPPSTTGAIALGQSGTHFNMEVPESTSAAEYPIYSSVNLAEEDEITRLNTLIGASTYKVPKIGSELARKFVYPTNAEGGTYGKFGYINHYWGWKNTHKIREDAAPGKAEKDRIHPIIYKSLLDMDGENAETFRYSGDTDRTQGSRPTIEFIRGGARTSINRIKADQERLKTILFKSGNSWQILGKQFALQLLNPREETRLWNPLSILAGSARIVKLQRHLSVEGLLNSIQSNKYIQMFTDPGNISPVTPGLYEIAEGYDKWDDYVKGKSRGARNKGNKLAKWSNESFKTDDTSDINKLGKRLGNFLKKSIVSNFDPTGLTGKLLGGDVPDPPSRYVDSQKTLSKKKKLTDGDGSKGQILEATPYDKLGSFQYGDTTQKVFIPRKTGPQLGQKRVNDVGHQGKPDVSPAGNVWYDALGFIPTEKSSKVDKINMIPYGALLPEENPDVSTGEYIRDFIKFRFKDMQTGANLVFRAILSGINDNITPDWSSERYIGRADSVHVYKGADRNISFNFSIAPKTQTEFPILMEKLNYLIGLCYPDYDSENSNRMVPPMAQLTIGSLLTDAPGFLNSLSYTVEESSNWEIQEGQQFPKFINVSCDFRYIGKGIPNKHGQHFGIHTGFWRTAGSSNIPAGKPISAESTAYESMLPLPVVPDIGQYSTGGIGNRPSMTRPVNVNSSKNILKPGTLGVPIPALTHTPDSQWYRDNFKSDDMTIRLDSPMKLKAIDSIDRSINIPKTGVLSKLKTVADYQSYKGKAYLSRAAKYTFSGRDNLVSTRSLSEDIFGLKLGG